MTTKQTQEPEAPIVALPTTSPKAKLPKLPKPDNLALVEMLQTKRPHKSKSEKAFIRKFIHPLGVEYDQRGNLIKRIGDAPVLWSSHTDSVHYVEGSQRVKIVDGILSLSKESHSSCLGADDAAGVWLMREMILANKPGLYIFHRAEECGGHGSRHISMRTPKLLDGIKYAIAFDRRGTHDVITHQRFSRCCSEAFALALADKLNHNKKLCLAYKPSPEGSFTDTANYMTLVPECTNLSVGYYSEHTVSERLDLGHLFRLRQALLRLDVAELPCTRDPKVVESRYSGFGRNHANNGNYWGEYGYYGYEVDGVESDPLSERAYDNRVGRWRRIPTKSYDSLVKADRGLGYVRTRPSEAASRSPSWSKPNVEETVRKNPKAVIKVLQAYGLTESQILDEIYEQGGAMYYF